MSILLPIVSSPKDKGTRGKRKTIRLAAACRVFVSKVSPYGCQGRFEDETLCMPRMQPDSSSRLLYVAETSRPPYDYFILAEKKLAHSQACRVTNAYGSANARPRIHIVIIANRAERPLKKDRSDSLRRTRRSRRVTTAVKSANTTGLPEAAVTIGARASTRRTNASTVESFTVAKNDL